MKRFHDALAIQEGACNPIAVSRALVAAIDEARAENGDHDSICADPAVRLIAHQLAYLLHIFQMDGNPGEYVRVTKLCEQRRDAL